MIEKKKILIVEDEEDVADELAARLEAADWDVIIAIDGEQGLKMARNGNPNLILLDVVMPKVDGYEVCRELKKDPKMKMIPIIMVTANTQENDKVLEKEAGADDYVTKPYDIHVLIGKIRGFLEAKNDT